MNHQHSKKKQIQRCPGPKNLVYFDSKGRPQKRYQSTFDRSYAKFLATEAVATVPLSSEDEWSSSRSRPNQDQSWKKTSKKFTKFDSSGWTSKGNKTSKGWNSWTGKSWGDWTSDDDKELIKKLDRERKELRRQLEREQTNNARAYETIRGLDEKLASAQALSTALQEINKEQIEHLTFQVERQYRTLGVICEKLDSKPRAKDPEEAAAVDHTGDPAYSPTSPVYSPSDLFPSDQEEDEKVYKDLLEGAPAVKKQRSDTNTKAEV